MGRMKISVRRYNELHEGFKAFAEHYGIETIKKKIAESGWRRTKWAILSQVVYDFNNDDDHPAFLTRTRINPYKGREWDLYDGGLNDNHIETAIDKIGKELELV